MNKRLELNFLNELSKTLRISLDDPKDDLMAEDIAAAMNQIVSFNAVGTDGVDIIGIDGAKIVTTTVEEIEL